MLSPVQAQSLASQYAQQKVANGFDMSDWPQLHSHPSVLTPEQLVLLSRHTGDEVWVLLKNGIGTANAFRDIPLRIDATGRITNQEPAALAA